MADTKRKEAYAYTKARLENAIKMIDDNDHIESIISMINSGIGEIKDYNNALNMGG